MKPSSYKRGFMCNIGISGENCEKYLYTRCILLHCPDNLYMNPKKAGFIMAILAQGSDVAHGSLVFISQLLCCMLFI